MRDDQNYNSQSVEVFTVLKDAFRTYRNFLTKFLGLGLIYGIFNEISELVWRRFSPQNIGVFILLNVFLTSWVAMAIIFTSSEICQGKTISLSEAFNKTRHRYFSFISVWLSTLMLVGIGVFLWIIPGIFVAVITIFTSLVTVLEETSYLESFRQSASLVRGYFWEVFLFLGCIFLLMTVTVLPLGLSAEHIGITSRLLKIVGVFLGPFLILAQVKLYYAIKQWESHDQFYTSS